MNHLLTLCLLLFATILYSQEPIEIPFTLSSNGHIIMAAKVNGVEGNFIFDTGAGLNLMTKKFADKVKDLEKTDHFYTGHRATGEAIQSDLWNTKSLIIGEFKISKERFAVFDFDFPLDGLISLTPFQHHPITIDFKHKIITIESAESLKKRNSDKDFEMPIQVSNDRDITIEIATLVKLQNELELQVNLDSGAGFDVYRFNSRYMDNLGIDSSAVKSEFRKSYFKPEQGNTFYTTEIKTLSDTEENITINNPKSTFIEGLIYEGIIGINWIGETITIDLVNKRLLVQQ